MSNQIEQIQSDIRLIQEVKKNSSLYDSRCKDKDPKSRELTWISIAKSMETTPEACKNRWKNLRDKYTREKKLMMIEGEESYRCHPWPLLDEMSFLWNFVSHRKQPISKTGVINLIKAPICKQKLTKPEWIVYKECENVLDPTCILIEEDKPIDGYDNEEETEDEEMNQPCSKLRRLLEHKEEENSMDGLQNENLTDSNYHSDSVGSLKITPSTRSLDEEEYFCMSLAGALRRLPKQDCSLVKIKILQLLHEVQYGKL